jgi:hypothetical protein
MRTRRLTRALICAVLPLAIASGCQALYPYRPISVLVRDAETKQPISGAEVLIDYPFTPPSHAPWDSSGTTAADGMARLKAAPAGGDIGVEARAKGYLFEDTILPPEAVRPGDTAHSAKAVDPHAPTVVLDLYAEPRPTVELVVPNGYRGVVKAELQIQEDAPCPPGQRCFSYEVPASGIISVTGPSLLHRVLDYRFRYADGTPLTRRASGFDVGSWWLRNEGNTQFFVVGTLSDYEEMRHSDPKQGEDHRSPNGGKGNGRGRRGGRGNPSSSDPSPPS